MKCHKIGRGRPRVALPSKSGGSGGSNIYGWVSASVPWTVRHWFAQRSRLKNSAGDVFVASGVDSGTRSRKARGDKLLEDLVRLEPRTNSHKAARRQGGPRPSLASSTRAVAASTASAISRRRGQARRRPTAGGRGGGAREGDGESEWRGERRKGRRSLRRSDGAASERHRHNRSAGSAGSARAAAGSPSSRWWSGRGIPIRACIHDAPAVLRDAVPRRSTARSAIRPTPSPPCSRPPRFESHRRGGTFSI